MYNVVISPSKRPVNLFSALCSILSMVIPIYIAELAPKRHRGRMVTLYQLATTGGTMIGFLTNLVAAMFTIGWRVALGMQCIFGIFLIVGMLFLPETPRWVCPYINTNLHLCIYTSH